MAVRAVRLWGPHRVATARPGLELVETWIADVQVARIDTRRVVAVVQRVLVILEISAELETMKKGQPGRKWMGARRATNLWGEPWIRDISV